MTTFLLDVNVLIALSDPTPRRRFASTPNSSRSTRFIDTSDYALNAMHHIVGAFN